MQVRDLGEFGLIERIERAAHRAGAPAGAWPIGPGDDAAVLRPRAGTQVAVTTDAFVEDVHFRWRSDAPRALGRRVLAATLSDLAAMGARPLGTLLALEVPPALALRRLDSVVRGLVAAGRDWGCPLVGGNVTRGPHTALTLTALGEVARGRALRRDGARVGDRLLVTGVLGAAALARARAERGGRARQVPEPRLRAGRVLARLRGVGGCIDVSDGLLADLGHLARASGVGARVDRRRLPRPPGFARACGRLGLDPETLLLSGGEDYELLFSVRPGAPSAAVLGRRLGVAVTEIGQLTRGRGVRLLPGGEGISRAPGPGRAGGWRHF